MRVSLVSCLLIFSLIHSITSWVIYRRAQKQRLVCREEKEWPMNTTLAPDEILARAKRDVAVDPQYKEPIIVLGKGKSNTTWFIDDGDFDIVSDQLSKDELDAVKQKILGVCANLLSPEDKRRRRLN